MKNKAILILFLVLLFKGSLFSQGDIPKLEYYATDLSGTLSSEEIANLNRALKGFDDQTSTQIVFLMVGSLEDYPIEMFANETAEKNKIGSKENNGVLFLIAKNDRKMRIEVGYGLEGTLPDALSGSIIRNEVAPYFRRNDYYSGIAAGLNAIMSATKGEYTRTEKVKEDKGGKGFPIGFIILLLIFFLFGRGGKGRGGNLGTAILLGSMLGGSGRSHGGGGGFGGSGFGGFSGGGGSFGGGGASGSW